MKKRKILIISHNPISKSDNMGKTIGNIFSIYSKEELCQLYFHDECPNFDICEQYFYINEVKILKSIFKKEVTGKVVQGEDCQENEKSANKDSDKGKLLNFVYQFGRKRNDFIFCARNLLWKLGKWFSKDLDYWLKKQNPSCIFLCAGDYYFLFDIASEISKRLQIPIFTYHVDDYYFFKKYKQKLGIDARIYRRKFREIFMKSEMNFCISEMMRDTYEKCFNKKTELLMNTSEKILPRTDFKNKKLIRMNYFGNIALNRWKNLSILSSVIVDLNKKYDKKIVFNIYSEENNQQLLKDFLSNKDVNFKGKISAEEVRTKMIESDILVHVENFDKDCVEMVKYSVSTKISDMLASNRLLLAFGPAEVASISYLKNNNVGLVIDKEDYDSIYAAVELIYNDINVDEFKKNALNLYYKNHKKLANKEILDKYLV